MALGIRIILNNYSDLSKINNVLVLIRKHIESSSSHKWQANTVPDKLFESEREVWPLSSPCEDGDPLYVVLARHLVGRPPVSGEGDVGPLDLLVIIEMIPIHFPVNVSVESQYPGVDVGGGVLLVAADGGDEQLGDVVHEVWEGGHKG